MVFIYINLDVLIWWPTPSTWATTWALQAPLLLSNPFAGYPPVIVLPSLRLDSSLIHFGGCSFQLVQIGQLFACDGGATPKQRTGTKEYGAIIICVVTIRLHNHFFSILAMCPAVQPNVLCVSNRLQSGKLSCIGCNTIFIKYIIITLFCHKIATGGLPAIIHTQKIPHLSDGPWFLLT